MLKILFFDIESSDLNANFGRMLNFGYMWQTEKKPTVLNICDYKSFKKDVTDDREICIAAREILLDADIIVSWFGRFFDIPFINTRLMDNHLDMLPEFGQGHIDCWFTARKKMRLHSNRLASVQAFLDLPEEKTPLTPKIWVRAKAGHVESLRYVQEHCYQDVLVLQQAFDRMSPLITLPACRVAKHKGEIYCTQCGGSKIVHNGTRLTQKKHYQRLLCHDCGKYFNGKEIRPC